MARPAIGSARQLLLRFRMDFISVVSIGLGINYVVLTHLQVSAELITSRACKRESPRYFTHTGVGKVAYKTFTSYLPFSPVTTAATADNPPLRPPGQVAGCLVPLGTSIPVSAHKRAAYFGWPLLKDSLVAHLLDVLARRGRMAPPSSLCR